MYMVLTRLSKLRMFYSMKMIAMVMVAAAAEKLIILLIIFNVLMATAMI
jgi:hypothetical protein